MGPRPVTRFSDKHQDKETAVSRISRRRFLATASATVAAGASARATVAAADGDVYRVIDQAPFGGQTRRLKLTRGGRYVTALIFPTDYPTHFRLKPELFPVCTPRGFPVTGSHEYCFIHHQSISCGHGKVLVDDSDRPIDFYRKLPFPDPDREDKWHRGFNLFQLGPSGIQRVEEVRWSVDDRITIHLTLQWQTRERHRAVGRTLLVEQRRYDVFQQGAFTIIDQYSRLAPAGKPVTLVADRHSFADVRLTDDAPFVFAARFVAHDGPMSDAAADRLYEEFSERQLP